MTVRTKWSCYKVLFGEIETWVPLHIPKLLMVYAKKKKNREFNDHTYKFTTGNSSKLVLGHLNPWWVLIAATWSHDCSNLCENKWVQTLLFSTLKSKRFLHVKFNAPCKNKKCSPNIIIFHFEIRTQQCFCLTRNLHAM